MCPPLAFITALILLCMEFTSALIFLIGMFSHSSSNAVRNCPGVLVVFRRLLTRLSNSSHKCSIGDKSGLYGGQSSGTMLLFAKKVLANSGYMRTGIIMLESHLCILPLLGSREQQSMATSLPNPSPYHNRPSPISNPLENASVGKPFPHDVGTDDVGRQHEKG